jgi:hypothetical protein
MQLVQAFFRESPNRTTLYDYELRTDGQPVYIGHASNQSNGDEADQNEPIWTIFKFTYDGSNFITKNVSTGDAIWSLRSEYFS